MFKTDSHPQLPRPTAQGITERSPSSADSAQKNRVSPALMEQCLKEHLELCQCDDKTSSRRHISLFSQKVLNTTSSTGTHTRLIDCGQLTPAERLIFPNSLFAISPLGQRLGNKCDDLIKRNSEKLSSLPETAAEQFRHCIRTLSDRRKALPTLYRLGEQLRQAYKKQFKQDLPVSAGALPQALVTHHDPHRCQTLCDVKDSAMDEVLPLLRAQQHCQTLSPEFIQSLGLRHNSEFIIDFLNSYLKAYRIDYFAKELEEHIPRSNTHSCYLDDLLTGMPMSKVKTGRIYQMMVLAVLADTVKLDQKALIQFARAGLLDTLLYQPPANLVSLIFTKDGREEASVALVENFFTSPQNLFYDLAGMIDHQGIEELINDGTPTQKRALAAQVAGYSRQQIEQIDDRTINWLLWEACRNLCALALAVTTTQYHFCVRAEDNTKERRKVAKRDSIRLADSGISIPLWSAKSVEQQNLAKLIRKYKPSVPQNALSIACGKGSCLASCMEAYKEFRTPWKLTGYDISPASLREASRFLTPANNIDMQLSIKDCAALDPESEQHQDLIIMRAPDPFAGHDSENIQNIWEKIFANAQRMLKPDGILVMTHFFESEYDFFHSLIDQSLVEVKGSGKNPLFNSVTHVHTKTGKLVGRDLYINIMKVKAK